MKYRFRLIKNHFNKILTMSNKDGFYNLIRISELIKLIILISEKFFILFLNKFYESPVINLLYSYSTVSLKIEGYLP